MTFAFVIMSEAIAASLAIAAKLFGTSSDAVTVAAGLILVERNSSPTIAVSSGTLIGRNS